jgi:peptidoglycan hydrolase CwlO-like protein
MEKPLTKEEAERKLKVQLKMLELQSQAFDEKINKVRNEIHELEKQNKKLVKENGDKTKIETNNEKINKLKKKLRELKKEKEQKLGGNYTDDTTVRPFIDI